MKRDIHKFFENKRTFTYEEAEEVLHQFDIVEVHTWLLENGYTYFRDKDIYIN